MRQRSAYIWNTEASQAGRQAKRDQLVAGGCDQVLIKGFGDTGTAHAGAATVPGDVWPQWSDAICADYAPMDATLWGYPWPGDTDITACVDALRRRWSAEVVLNPETEWRWQNSNANSWNSLAEANAAAEAWMDRLIAACQAAFGRVPSFGCSSCPSWYDLPYEGFMKKCDFALPEHYFFHRLMAGGEDMVQAHIRRAGTSKPVYPVVTACGEYDDAGVLQLGTDALADYPNVQGFSSWEAGNGAYQADAVRRVYALLPPVQVTAASVPSDPATAISAALPPAPQPSAQTIHVYTDAQAETRLDVNFGGEAVTVDNFSIIDATIDVTNAGGEKWQGRIQQNIFAAWRKTA